MFLKGNKISKGRIPWNKGKIGVQISSKKGLKIPHIETCKCPFCQAKRGKFVPWHKGKRFLQISGKNHFKYKYGLYSKYIIPQDRLEILALRQKEYRRKNPQYKFWNIRRKFLLSKAGKLDLKTIQQIYEDNIKQYGTLTCYLCFKPIEFGQDSLEHKIPISRGGNNQKKNLAIAHKGCNCKKHTKTEEEYRKILEVQN